MVSTALIASIGALSGLALAVPTTPSPQYSLEQIARVIAAAPVNIYLDIKFNGFSGVAPIAKPTVGLLAQSPLNSIAYGTLDVATELQGQPAMTTVYQDSTVKEVELKSFYYGCVVGLENSQIASLLGCTITAECLGSKGESIKKQDFSFKKNGGKVQEMEFAKAYGFKGCEKINFNTKYDLPLVGATVMDTIDYIVSSDKPLSP